ncbi:hypothetical protein BV898_07396 [Hypsibius exemplaris]|uniref:Palmitoyltransferase n=1 Tax=Hypsibius exemplaris TaxID=2072580 RepID=A0A1W0WTQ2_HYPEX|nr:hypothetical protein BV898_07396 [Hypsibius exemplaris]
MAPYSSEKLTALEKDLELQQPEDYAKTAFVVHSGAGKQQFLMKRQYTWTVAGQEILTDWCYHCNIFKPPRVHHCKLCGKCIGGLYYPREELGYLATTILEVAAAGANLHFLNILLTCQCDLLKLGITVHEFKTDKYFNKTLHRFRSPFDRGSFWANFREACFTPWRPSEVIPKSSIPTISVGTKVLASSAESKVTKKRNNIQSSDVAFAVPAVSSAKAVSVSEGRPSTLSTITEEPVPEVYRHVCTFHGHYRQPKEVPVI